MFHVARQELERNFKIVLLAETARMQLKSSANESWYLPRPFAPSFVAIGAESTVRRPFTDSPM
jgi:hypothetical protein